MKRNMPLPLNPEIYKTALNNIEILRERKGVPQEYMAYTLGVTKGTYNKKIKGSMPFYISELVIIADIFSVDFFAMFQKDFNLPLESRYLAACRKAKELGLESALIEHLEMLEYKIQKAENIPKEQAG